MIKRFFKKSPIVFPLVAIFHVLVTMHAVWLFFKIPYDDGLDRGRLIDILTMMLLSVLWFFLTDLRKWAAISYVLLVIASVALHYFTSLLGEKGSLVSPFFPASLLFCFFILVYFKKFE